MQELDSIHNTESKIPQDSNPLKEARNTESKQNLDSKKDISLNAQYDKILDSSKSVDKNAAEVSLSDFSKETSFCSFQGGGEGSYLVGNDQADTADAVAKQHSCEALVQTCKRDKA